MKKDNVLILKIIFTFLDPITGPMSPCGKLRLGLDEANLSEVFTVGPYFGLLGATCVVAVYRPGSLFNRLKW